MSDKVQNLTIILDEERDSDDIDDIIKLLSTLNFVADVTPEKVMDINAYMARKTVRNHALYAVLDFVSHLLHDTEESKQILDIMRNAHRKEFNRNPSY